MPNMRKIVPVFVKPLSENVLCKSSRVGAKYHVAGLDTSDFGSTVLSLRCNSNVWNTSTLLAYPSNTQVEVVDVCKRCLKYTEEVK